MGLALNLDLASLLVCMLMPWGTTNCTRSAHRGENESINTGRRQATSKWKKEDMRVAHLERRKETYHAEGEHFLHGVVLPLDVLLLVRRFALERQRDRWFERASDLLFLVRIDSLFFELGSFTVSVVGSAAEIALVGRNTINFAVAGCEGLMRSLVCLWQLPVDWVGQLVARAVDEGLGHVVFCLAFRSAAPHVAFSVRSHGSNHPSAFGIDQGRAIRSDIRRGWLVGHLEQALLLIQVPNLLLLVSLRVRVVRSIVRPHLSVVLVLEHFVFDSDTVLAGDACHVFVTFEVRLKIGL